MSTIAARAQRAPAARSVAPGQQGIAAAVARRQRSVAKQSRPGRRVKGATTRALGPLTIQKLHMLPKATQRQLKPLGWLLNYMLNNEDSLGPNDPLNLRSIAKHPMNVPRLTPHYGYTQASHSPMPDPRFEREYMTPDAVPPGYPVVREWTPQGWRYRYPPQDGPLNL